jgi:hypothetical protein
VVSAYIHWADGVPHAELHDVASEYAPMVSVITRPYHQPFSPCRQPDKRLRRVAALNTDAAWDGKTVREKSADSVSNHTSANCHRILHHAKRNYVYDKELGICQSCYGSRPAQRGQGILGFMHPHDNRALPSIGTVRITVHTSRQ